MSTSQTSTSNVMVKSGLVISFSVILVAIGFQYRQMMEAKQHIQQVLQALERLESSGVLPDNRPKVAVGLGSCMDTYVSADELLKTLNAKPSRVVDLTQTDSGGLPERLMTLKDIEATFITFFNEGAAAERFVHNSSLFSELIAAVDSLSWSSGVLGGNAAVMANRLSIEGCNVLLGARITKRMRPLMHQNVTTVDSDFHQEDVHLIMEYKTGDVWGQYTAPRANRFILHHDQENAVLGALEELKAQISAFEPELLVLGGLQMMDRYPFMEGQRQLRLNALTDFLVSTPRPTRVHFEMASFVDEELMFDLINRVIPYANSLGMNEQELPNLLSLLEEGRVTSVSETYPRVASMLDQMRKVWEILEKNTPLVNGKRPLTRMHLHTLAYQIIIVRKATGWSNTRAAAAKASLTAHRHACGGRNDIDATKSKLLMDESFSMFAKPNSPRVHFNATEPVACWDEGVNFICIAPVLVCTEVKRTAGGGDNISAAALAVQLLPEDVKKNQ